jgi:hypothetical protein
VPYVPHLWDNYGRRSRRRYDALQSPWVLFVWGLAPVAVAIATGTLRIPGELAGILIAVFFALTLAWIVWCVWADHRAKRPTAEIAHAPQEGGGRDLAVAALIILALLVLGWLYFATMPGLLRSACNACNEGWIAMLTLAGVSIGSYMVVMLVVAVRHLTGHESG